MEDNKGNENTSNTQVEGDNNNINIETLTKDLLERDTKIAQLEKEKLELENAYKVLYERGNFNTQNLEQSKETEKKVTYDDILNRL